MSVADELDPLVEPLSEEVLELGLLSELSLLEDEEEGDDPVVEELEGEVEEDEGEVEELPELEVEGVEPVVLEDPGEDEELDTGDEPVVPEVEVQVPEVVELPDMIDDPPPSGHWHGSYPSPPSWHT